MAGASRNIGAPPASLRADVWTYFGFNKQEGKDELDKKQAICRICNGKVKYSGNTTNLRNHLTRHHPAETQPTRLNQTSLKQVMAPKLPGNSQRAQKITQAIAVFICKDLRPYSVVENDGFRRLVTTLEPRYVLPTRKQLSEVTIPNMYACLKQSLETSLQSADNVALTCDCWTSRATDSYLTVTAHYIDNDWALVCQVLQTRAVETSHTASNLSDMLTEVIGEWKLNNKTPAIVTDNAANIVRAVEMMGLQHIGCFAHLINLASQAALKVPTAARLLGRVRRIAAFFHRSTTASHKLKEKQKVLELPVHKLVTDVVTRWNSSLEMLDRFLEQQPAISAALLSPEVRRNEQDLCTLTEMDITIAEDLVKALQPLKAATLIMSEEKNPTVSVIAPLHAQLLEEMSCAPKDSAVIKEVKTAAYNSLNSRYVALKDRLYVASALDPRFKALPFLSDEARDHTFSRLATEAAHGEQAEAPVQTAAFGGAEEAVPEPVEDATPPKRPKESSALMSLLGSAYMPKELVTQKTQFEKAQDEIKKYREVTSLPLSENPLNWWRAHTGEYPLMTRQAKRYLCVPGTSVPSERVFSTAGDIVTAKRSCLTPQHVDQLLFLQKNLTFSDK